MGRLSAWLCMLVGCYSPAFETGAPCTEDRDCPASQRCVENTCGGMPRMQEHDAAIDAPVVMPDGGPDAPKPPMMVTYVIDQPNMMRDTWLYSATPTQSYGSGTQGSVDAEDNETSLFWFDLSAIPTNATVTSATFRVRTDNTGVTGTVNVFAMAQSWVEAEATYLVRMNGVGWTTPCAQPPSRATTVLGTFSPAVAQTYYDVTIQPAAVQAWVTNPANNFGITLVWGTTTQHVHVHLKESGSPPKLTVNALVPQP